MSTRFEIYTHVAICAQTACVRNRIWRQFFREISALEAGGLPHERLRARWREQKSSA
jgi:hypothetical protein